MSDRKNIQDTLAECGAGVFEQQASYLLQQIAHGVAYSGKVGELTIKLKLKRIGEGHQVAVTHAIKGVKPTQRGRETTEHEDSSVFFVTRKGLDIAPDTQMKFDFDKEQTHAD